MAEGRLSRCIEWKCRWQRDRDRIRTTTRGTRNAEQVDDDMTIVMEKRSSSRNGDDGKDNDLIGRGEEDGVGREVMTMLATIRKWWLWSLWLVFGEESLECRKMWKNNGTYMKNRYKKLKKNSPNRKMLVIE